MAIRTRTLTAGTATIASAAAVAIAALGESQADEPGGVRTDCARQSGANFPAAYTDRRNLVVGPLALIGGATFTDAAAARRFGGNKFPLLVRPGHTVTVSLPRSERQVVSLAYGHLPQRELQPHDGQAAVTFVACSAADSQSTADGPVTFWSGFVMTDSPRCVALDISVDGKPAVRRHIALGRHCAKPPPLRDCGSRGEGGRPLSTTPRSDDIVVGAIHFAGLRRIAIRRELDLDRSGRGYGVKSGVLVPAGIRATLSIGRSARGWAALDYASRQPGKPPPRATAAIRFQACAADKPAFSYDGPVGPLTGFPGGFRLKHRGCVPVEVRVAGRPAERAKIPFGIGQRC